MIKSRSLRVLSRVRFLAVPVAVSSPSLSSSSSKSASCKLDMLAMEDLFRRRLWLEFEDDADADAVRRG